MRSEAEFAFGEQNLTIFANFFRFLADFGGFWGGSGEAMASIFGIFWGSKNEANFERIFERVFSDSQEGSAGYAVGA